MAEFSPAIRVVMLHEGGYADHPSDPGGATNWGISLRYLRALGVDVGDTDGDGDVDAADVRALTKAQAEEIYRHDWWEPMRLGEIVHQAVATKTLDLAVNMGHIPGVKILQRALHCAGRPEVEADGVIGPQTIGAANEANPDQTLGAMRAEARRYYLDLIARRPALGEFRDGWVRRALA